MATAVFHAILNFREYTDNLNLISALDLTALFGTQNDYNGYGSEIVTWTARVGRETKE